MIATDHQLTVTLDRLQKFEANIQALKKAEPGNPLAAFQLRSAIETVADLQAEVDEYRSLVSGVVRDFAADTVEDLPAILIKARIARRLSQSDLAEMLGVKPQQVQRWESQFYENTAFSRLSQIASLLRVRLSERIELVGDDVPVPASKLKRLLSRLGIPQEVVERRLLPRSVTTDFSVASFDELNARLSAIFGWSARALVNGQAALPASGLRFKLPASAAQNRTRAYAAYVDGLCRIVASVMSQSGRFSSSWRTTRSEVFGDGAVDLEVALNACWDKGIAVLPLRDPVAFHGAYWEENGKRVIVLKQNSDEESKWLQDLLHELFHNAVDEPADGLSITRFDETSPERRESDEEKRAHRFAAQVVTDGQYAEVTERIVREANGFGPALKNATIAVAQETGLPVGVLANLLAWRLGENGTQWWAVAAGLQGEKIHGFDVARRVFVKRFPLNSLPRFERDLLIQALEV